MSRPASSKRFLCCFLLLLLLLFSSFELGSTAKHLMTGPAGNCYFCFPSTSIFPSASPRKNIEGLGETNVTVYLGASH